MTEAQIDGLRGEVIHEDIYRLRTVRFSPDVVFDLGANIGIFATHARAQFPAAMVVCVEPHPENFAILKATHGSDSRVTLLNKAVGGGNVYHANGAANGSGECYLTPGLGYPEQALSRSGGYTKVATPSVHVSELVEQWVKPRKVFLIKMDIEGGEAAVFAHRPSIEAMKRAEYLAFEIHRYALTGAEHPQMLKDTARVLAELEETHHCTQEHVIFRATRRR